MRKSRSGLCARCNKRFSPDFLYTDERIAEWRYLRYCPGCLASVIQEHTLTCDCGATHVSVYAPPSYSFMPIDTRCPLCRIQDRNREHHTVITALSCARKHNAPATLLLEEWMQTLQDHKGLCAYCNIRPYQVLEHFIPLPNGGTVRYNCVPACKSCNGAKRDTHPDYITSIPKKEIERVKFYLDQFSPASKISV